MNIPNQEPEQDRARCEWDFTLRTTVSSAAASSSDALGVIECHPSARLFATGGIARKIRLYPLHTLLPPPTTTATTQQLEHATACSSCICTPAKLSSLKWRPHAGGGVIGCGDYDGVVTEYDLERGGIPTFERDEHGGRRVWSVDYGGGGAVVGASGSDDGTAHVWDPRCEGGECVAVIRPSGSGSAVCCVEFNRPRGTTLAVGCADRKVYVYDCRMLVHPLLTLDSHTQTVTYVKFLDETTLVSASIDGSLKLWDLVNNSTEPVRTYRGHSNGRNFVGLSVWNGGGLLGCGSESNQAFVYDRRWGEPIWVHGFKPVNPNSDGFVSSVCWKQDVENDDGGQCTFVAGGSDGTLRVFEGIKKKSLTNT
ncbi:WD repeat-containing protein RUP2 [Linum grandiflorum]